LRYLVTKHDEGVYSQFVASSLGPERELYDTINRAVEDRGAMLPIEKRMLKSIESTCRASAVRIEDAKPKYGDWGGGLRARLKAIDLETSYLGIQRIPSHAVHGSWVDLVMNHLKEKDRRFEPDSSWRHVDARLLSPVALFVLGSVGVYFDRFLSELPEAQPLLIRTIDLHERTKALDGWHEALLSAK
jgi:hypothetical protein